MSPKRLEVELTLRDTQRPELADDELNPTSGLGVRFNACDAKRTLPARVNRSC
jgi:hypothetical protein